jgi:acyl transferase domain-containing protein
MNGIAHLNGSEPTNDVEHTNGLELTNHTANGNMNGHATHGEPKNDTVKRLIVLSAKSESSLTTYLSSFLEYLDSVPDTNTFMKDLSFTLGQRRTHHAHRIAVAADSLASLKAQLSTAKSKKIKERIVTFVFTGQGAQ